jgi:hypothetical protein
MARTTARPEIVKAGGRTLSFLRLTITDAGRQAIDTGGVEFIAGARWCASGVAVERRRRT